MRMKRDSLPQCAASTNRRKGQPYESGTEEGQRWKEKEGGRTRHELDVTYTFWSMLKCLCVCVCACVSIVDLIPLDDSLFPHHCRLGWLVYRSIVVDRMHSNRVWVVDP